MRGSGSAVYATARVSKVRGRSPIGPHTAARDAAPRRTRPRAAPRPISGHLPQRVAVGTGELEALHSMAAHIYADLDDDELDDIASALDALDDMRKDFP
jgi:hypothetical protein